MAYLKQVPSGRVFVYSEQLAARNDMVAYEGPVENGFAVASPLLQSVAAAVHHALDPRVANMIRSAVTQIPAEEWGKQVGKNPALPKVGAVSKLVGFKVSMAELLESMGSDAALATEMGEEEEAE